MFPQIFINFLDLGSLDNLTLPIISGGCILEFFKLLGMAASWIVADVVIGELAPLCTGDARNAVAT
jgi:hypothetical protein